MIPHLEKCPMAEVFEKLSTWHCWNLRKQFHGVEAIWQPGNQKHFCVTEKISNTKKFSSTRLGDFFANWATFQRIWWAYFCLGNLLLWATLQKNTLKPFFHRFWACPFKIFSVLMHLFWDSKVAFLFCDWHFEKALNK